MISLLCDLMGKSSDSEPCSVYIFNFGTLMIVSSSSKSKLMNAGPLAVLQFTNSSNSWFYFGSN